MALILQKGTTEVRVHVVVLLQRVSVWITGWEFIARERIDISQELLEITTSGVCPLWQP